MEVSSNTSFLEQHLQALVEFGLALEGTFRAVSLRRDEANDPNQ